MRHTAVIEMKRYFCKGIMIADHHLLGSFNLLQNDKILHRGVSDFRKKIGQVTVAVVQFLR